MCDYIENNYMCGYSQTKLAARCSLMVSAGYCYSRQKLPVPKETDQWNWCVTIAKRGMGISCGELVE
jgi:hypothetical protein